MGSGAICPVCDRHYEPPECRCGYLEGPRAEGRLTRVRPARRATDEASFLHLARESWERMDPDVLGSARSGLAEARKALAASVERKRLRRAGWARPVENVETGGRL